MSAATAKPATQMAGKQVRNDKKNNPRQGGGQKADERPGQKMIYRKISACFQRIFDPIRLMLRPVKIPRLHQWIITGEEILSKHKLAIIYAGSEKNKNFLAKLAFDNSYREDYIGKRRLWRIPKAANEKGHNCSLMVTEMREHKSLRMLFEKKKYFYIPCWIYGEANIPLHISGSSAQEDLRRIRKGNLGFEVTNQAGQFHNFYYNMYLPFVTRRHKDRAVLMGYDDMMQRLEAGNCELLLIKKANKYIAGQLLVYGEGAPRLWSVGVKDGNPSYLKDSVIAATICFSARYLEEKGYKRVGLGGLRAFLKDGVLQYKKKWGLQIVRTTEKGFLIKPLSKTAGTKGFFLNNPFIWMDKMKFNGAIFVEAGAPLAKKDFEEIYKEYYLMGVSKLFIYRFEEGDGRKQEVVPYELSDIMSIRSAESLF